MDEHSKKVSSVCIRIERLILLRPLQTWDRPLSSNKLVRIVAQRGTTFQIIYVTARICRRTEEVVPTVGLPTQKTFRMGSLTCIDRHTTPQCHGQSYKASTGTLKNLSNICDVWNPTVCTTSYLNSHTLKCDKNVKESYCADNIYTPISESILFEVL